MLFDEVLDEVSMTESGDSLEHGDPGYILSPPRQPSITGREVVWIPRLQATTPGAKQYDPYHLTPSSCEDPWPAPP